MFVGVFAKFSETYLPESAVNSKRHMASIVKGDREKVEIFDFNCMALQRSYFVLLEDIVLDQKEAFDSINWVD